MQFYFRVVISVHFLFLVSSTVSAEIFRWDNGELIPDSVGIAVMPGAKMANLGLEFADLRGVDLTNADLSRSTLSNARLDEADLSGAYLFRTKMRTSSLEMTNLSSADLTSADLRDSLLSNAIFSDAKIRGTILSNTTSKGFTKEQLYSTQSYKEKQLHLNLAQNDLSGWDFSFQDLGGSALWGTDLTDADFTDATVSYTHFYGSNLVKDQLYSTASYREKDLQGIFFGRINNLSGWDFTGQNLSKASFAGTELVDASFDGALIPGANFRSTVSRGFKPAQLYSTLSYQVGNLQRTIFGSNNLSGWDFSGQNLSHSDIDRSALVDANFASADLTNADLYETDFTNADLSQAKLASTGLHESKFVNADLTNANLTGASMHDVVFENTKLNGTSLAAADLNGVSLQAVDLTGTNLGNSNLQGVTGIELAIVNGDTTYNQWTEFPPGFDPQGSGLTFKMSPEGDYNSNGELDSSDLDLFGGWIHRSSRRPPMPVLDQLMDLNSDSAVNRSDIHIFVKDLANTWYGDANLDGVFNSADFVAVFQAGEYEDGIFWNSEWSTGDWNGDGEFDSADFVRAFQDGGYEKGPRERVLAVPEPSPFLLVISAMLTIVHRLCRKGQ